LRVALRLVGSTVAPFAAVADSTAAVVFMAEAASTAAAGSTVVAADMVAADMGAADTGKPVRSLI
jgi:hypothetical protein